MQEPGTASSATIPWPQRPLRTRLVGATVSILLVVVLPVAIGYWLGYPKEALATGYGAIVTVSSVMASGLRTTRYAVPYYVLAIVLGALTKPVHGNAESALLDGWLWVALVATLAVVSGLATRRGAGVAMSMATLYAVVVPPLQDRDSVLHTLAFLLLGCLYGALISLRLGARDTAPDPPTPPRMARTIALFLGLAAGLGAAIAVVSAVPHGSWVVAAVVVLGIPTPGITERMILWRLLGQLGACAVVFAITTLITRAEPAQPMVWFGLAAGISAVGYVTSLGSNPAIAITFLSSTLLFPVAAFDYQAIGGMVGGRLLDNLVGLAILALALLGVRLWAGPPTSSGVEPGTPH